MDKQPDFMVIIWRIGQFELVRYRGVYENIPFTFFYLVDWSYPYMDYRHSTLVGSI